MTFQSHYQRGQGAQWGRGGTPYHSSKAQGGEDNRTHTTHSQPHASHSSRVGPEHQYTTHTQPPHSLALSFSLNLSHNTHQETPHHATSHHTMGLATPRPRYTPNSWLLKQVATSHNLSAPLTTTFIILL